MTYIFIVLGLVIVSQACLIVAYTKERQISKDMLANLGLELARFRTRTEDRFTSVTLRDKTIQAQMDKLHEQNILMEKKFDELSDTQTNALVDALNERWEKATQAINNFDPFHPEGDK